MRILVTGGRGFLGRSVCCRLSGAAEYYAPAHRDLDLLDYTAVLRTIDKGRFTHVIHLAGRVGGIKDNMAAPADFLSDNLAMGLNILRASHAVGRIKRIVMVGTTCSYPADAKCPIKEDTMWAGYPAPETAPYGLAKRILFTACQTYWEQYGLHSVLLVPTNLYGPRDTSSHVIPDLVRKFCSGANTVELYSSRATRDFLYVGDCAQAIIAALDGPEIPVIPINIASGRETNILKVARMIRKITGSSAKIRSDPDAPEGNLRRVLDVTRASIFLPTWRPLIGLEEGLWRTVAAYKG